MTDKSKSYIWLWSTIIILIIIVLGYINGFRLGGKYLIGKVGLVNIELPLSGTSIIVDGTNKMTAKKDGQQVSLELSPKKHEIVINHENFYPWIKTVSLDSGQKINIKPFFINKNPTGVMIGMRDPEYWSLRQKIEKDKLPTKDKPLVSPDGVIKVWAEEGSILANLNGNVHTIVSPQSDIKSVSFFADRTDAIVFSTDKNVFVIDVDSSTAQNFMTIYTGTDPRSIPGDIHYMYVLDRDLLMQVAI